MPRQDAATVKRPVVDRHERQGAPAPEETKGKEPVIKPAPHDPSKHSFYYLRQYGGLTLGTAACVGTAGCYDQLDDFRVWKLVGWLLLALVGLLIHEIRPFRRMNYGDVQQPSK